MFQGCTSLQVAPKLPAESLNYSCYKHMFQGYKSLKIAPELHATTLFPSCYANMFMDCEELESLTCLATQYKAEGAEPKTIIGEKSLIDYTTDWLVITSTGDKDKEQISGKNNEDKNPVFKYATTNPWVINSEQNAVKDRQGLSHYYGIPEGWKQEPYKKSQQ